MERKRWKEEERRPLGRREEENKARLTLSLNGAEWRARRRTRAASWPANACLAPCDTRVISLLLESLRSSLHARGLRGGGDEGEGQGQGEGGRTGLRLALVKGDELGPREDRANVMSVRAMGRSLGRDE